MKIAEDTAVTVNYYLSASKNNAPEELVEQTSPEHPFAFLYGFGGVLPDFESNLANKQKGDKFDFKIEAEKAYGIYDNEYVAKIDKQAFVVDGEFDSKRIKIGEDIEMNDAEGNQLVGKVLSIDDTIVTMDFNHPLAGFDLHFVGEVLDVRAATAEELDHGHIHGAHGHQH